MRCSVLVLFALSLPTAACGSDFVESTDTDGTSSSSGSPTTTQPPLTTSSTSTTNSSGPTTTGELDSSSGGDTTTTGDPADTTGSSDSTGAGDSSSSSSTGDPQECGDGTAEGDEACDGDDVLGQACADVGFFFGDLGCTDACELDTASCSNTAEFCISPDAAISDAAPLGSTLTIPTNAFVASVATPVALTHPDVGELGLALRTPDDLASIRLATAACPGVADIDGRFIDGAAAPDCIAPVAIEGDVGPANAFAALVGAPAMGDWTLSVTDTLAGNDGTLDSWCLQLELSEDNPTVCGDDSITFGEDCDDDDLAGLTCADFEGFIAGTLGCDAVACTFDTSACVAPGCGNGLLEPGSEDCDGDDLGGMDCTDVGFASGTLACDGDCAFDTSACSTCGDNITDGTDVCDGTSLGGATCADEGFAGGTIGCLDDCSGLDTSGCTDDVIAVCSTPELSLNTANPVRTDVITVDAVGNIADIDVFVRIDHTWVGDLDVALSTATQSATLVSNQCSDVDDILAVFDDAASAAPDCTAPVAIEGGVTPVAPLAAFNGESAADDYTLAVSDSFPMGEFGSFDEWCVFITLE